MTPSTECSNSGLLPQIKFLHGTVLRFWQLDYHLPASAKSMIRTALAAQGWCGRVSGVFWARTPFQFMDGGSVRIPGWATVMGARSSGQKRNAAHSAARLRGDRCGVLAASSRLSSPSTVRLLAGCWIGLNRPLLRLERDHPNPSALSTAGTCQEDVTIFFIRRARGARPRGVKNRDPRRGVSKRVQASPD